MRGLTASDGHRSDEGAVLVMVVLVVVVTFGVAMLAVDAGDVWVTRRSIVTGTDAAALAAATGYAVSRATTVCGTSELSDLVRSNAAGATVTDCQRTVVAPGAGYVTVTASMQTEIAFGKVLGVGDQTITSTSSAMWGPSGRITALRPITLCKDDVHVRAVLGAGTDDATHGVAGVHRVYVDTSDPADCLSSGTNFAFLNFDEGEDSAAETREWLLNGYPGTVAIDDCDDDGVPGDGCLAGSGPSGSSLDGALDTLVDTGRPLVLPVFGEITSAPRRYDIVAFVGAVLHGFDVNRDDDLPGQRSYLDLEFREVVSQGGCCSLAVPDTGVRSIRICSVDHDTASTAERCSAA